MFSQTVTAEQSSWLHKLLRAAGRVIGHEVLLNTSFNTRGKPILNSIHEALRLLDSTDGLDGVVIEDVLFTKNG